MEELRREDYTHTHWGGGKNHSTIAAQPMDVLAPDQTADRYTIPSLGFENGPFLFSYLRTFLAYITPNDVPVVYCVLELLRDAFNMRVSFPQLVFEALKIESGFICLMVLFVVVALLPLGMFIVWGCCYGTRAAAAAVPLNSNGNMRPGHNMSTRSPFHVNVSEATNSSTIMYSSSEMLPSVDSLNIQESREEKLVCRQKVLSVCLQIGIFLWTICTILLFVTNEQIVSAVDETPNVIRMSLKDSEFFVKDSYRFLSTNVNDRIGAIVNGMTDDLDNVDKLLGDAIQEELAESTRIESIFENILNISAENIHLVRRLDLIYKTLGMALQICGDAASRLEDLQIQLSFIQSQCIAADRPLCDTLRLKNFDEFGIMETLLELRKDKTLLKIFEWSSSDPMKTYRDYDGATEWRNLTLQVDVARTQFQSISGSIKKQTEAGRLLIVEDLKRLHDAASDSLRTMGIVARRTIDRIDLLWGQIVPHFDGLAELASILWIVGVFVAFSSLLTILVLIGALSCGCFTQNAQQWAAVMHAFGSALICLISVTFAVFACVALLIGGHGEMFLCQPLHDSPDYLILRRLFDKPGLVFKVESERGLFHDILVDTQHHGFANASLNVSLDRVIVDCERRSASFDVFQLDGLVNVSHLLEHGCETDIVHHINGILPNWTSLRTLTEPLHNQLNRIMYDSRINLTSYRLALSQPTPARDVATFTDQLQRVAIQIKDVGTSSRMTTLGSKARRLQMTVLQQLEQYRTELLYQLTAFDLQKSSWELTINKSLDNLEFTQNFFIRHSHSIYNNKTNRYRDKLYSHLQLNLQLLNASLHGGHNLSTTTSDNNGGTGSCYPLFQIFATNRILLCQRIMDPVNGLWFTAFFCIVLFAVLQPFSLALVAVHTELRRVRKRLQRSISHHQYG